MPIDPKILQYILPALVIVAVLFFRMRRSMKPQPLKPKRLLLRPGIIIVAAVILMAQSPPPPDYFIWIGIAGLIGAAIGWYWGKFTQLHLHPENGTVMSKDSQAAVIVLLVLLLFRYGVRAGIGVERQALHLDVAAITDIFIVFSALLYSARGLEIFLRAQKLLQAPSP